MQIMKKLSTVPVDVFVKKIFQKKEKFINKNAKSIRVLDKTVNFGMKCNKIVISLVPLTELIFMLWFNRRNSYNAFFSVHSYGKIQSSACNKEPK